MPQSDDPFAAWFGALEARHLARLTIPEVRRGLQALSALYVERRQRLPAGAALGGEGKRAAFALYYAPLHFLVTRHVVRELGAARPAPRLVVDLGCGTGPAGAAWALEARGRCRVAGVDRSGWALDEARWTYAALGVDGRAARGDVDRAELPGRGGAVVAAFAVNEIAETARGMLLARLLEAAGRGARVLVIEPIARRPLPWWDAWSAAFQGRGGRDDSWRFSAERPQGLILLGRAARLDQRELTARSLYLAPPM